MWRDKTSYYDLVDLDLGESEKNEFKALEEKMNLKWFTQLRFQMVDDFVEGELVRFTKKHKMDFVEGAIGHVTGDTCIGMVGVKFEGRSEIVYCEPDMLEKLKFDFVEQLDLEFHSWKSGRKGVESGGKKEC
jgi:hypothetical protein